MTRYFSNHARSLLVATVLAGFVFGEVRAMTEQPILMGSTGTSSDHEQLTVRDDGSQAPPLWVGTIESELTNPLLKTDKLPNKITGKINSASFAVSVGGHGIALATCAHAVSSNSHSLVTQHIRLQV